MAGERKENNLPKFTSNVVILDRYTDWQNKWLMRFQEKKCYIMRISQARSQLHFEYSLNGSKWQSTSCHSYLGVEICSDSKWNNHISCISAKANRTLGFVRRNLKSCSKRIKLFAYSTLDQFWSMVPLSGTHTLTSSLISSNLFRGELSGLSWMIIPVAVVSLIWCPSWVSNPSFFIER